MNVHYDLHILYMFKGNFSLASVTLLDARSTGDQEVAVRHSFGNILSWRSDHEIFSTIILSLPLIQEGQLSVSGKRMCT